MIALLFGALTGAAASAAVLIGAANATSLEGIAGAIVGASVGALAAGLALAIARTHAERR